MTRPKSICLTQKTWEMISHPVIWRLKEKILMCIIIYFTYMYVMRACRDRGLVQVTSLLSYSFERLRS